MEYQEIYAEFILLLHEKTVSQDKLSILRSGYISVKTISGKRYSYLQYRTDGKLLSEYIHEEDLPAVRDELSQRAMLSERLSVVNEQLNKLKAAARVLSGSLYRKLTTLRRCVELDSMPVHERQKSLAFANAMTALEGIPASSDTDKNLSQWARGKYSFQESYKNTLRAYHLAEI